MCETCTFTSTISFIQESVTPPTLSIQESITLPTSFIQESITPPTSVIQESITSVISFIQAPAQFCFYFPLKFLLKPPDGAKIWLPPFQISFSSSSVFGMYLSSSFLSSKGECLFV